MRPDPLSVLPQPLNVLRATVSRAAPQRLEFAAQRAELFDEVDAFGLEIRELF